MKKIFLSVVLAVLVIVSGLEVSNSGLLDNAKELEPTIFSFELSKELEPTIFSFEFSKELEPTIFSYKYH